MSHTEVPFPRRELTGVQHQQVRDLLIREAASTTRRRTPGRWRFAVPVAALAVGAAVAGSTAVLGDWHLSHEANPAAQVDDDSGCGFARHATLIKGTGLLFQAPVAAGVTPVSYVNEERYCAPDTRPVVSFVSRRADGTVTSAVTVWRSLPPDIGIDPEGVAAGTASTAPVDGDDPGTVPNAPSSQVPVRSTYGRLIKGGKLTWIEPDGQRWSLTGAGLSDDELCAIAGELQLGKATAVWPQAPIRGYRTLVVPRTSLSKQPKEKSWQPVWYLDYGSDQPGADTDVSVRADRTSQPWQASISSFPMPVRLVSVSGRPGVLTDNGDPAVPLLITNAQDGTQLTLLGRLPSPSMMVTFAEQVKLVTQLPS